MTPTILQTAGRCGGTWASGNWWDALWCPVAQPLDLGMGFVALMMAVGGFVVLYNWADGLTLPGTWLALMMAFVVNSVPGQIGRYAVGIVSIIAAIGFYAIWRRSR